MADNDPMKSFMNMFKDFGSNLNVPTPQVDTLLDSYRKDLQAWQDAARVTSTGGQAMLDKQRDALEQALAGIAEMVQGASSAGADPSKIISDPVALSAKSFEMTLAHATEMSEIARESGAEAVDILRKRVEESLADMTGGALGKKQGQ